VPINGPRVARLLRGGKTSLRAELARRYWTVHETTPSQSALADALVVLEGMAIRTEPEPLYLRVAKHRDCLVLDLGDETGRAIVIGPHGWRVVDEPPVLFRRTSLTGVLPDPCSGGDLGELWQLVNVDQADRPVLTAALVHALFADEPHVITALTGEQGTGKTSASKRIVGLIDPSAVPVRKAPKDADTWITAAAGSWCVALDNLSGLPDWLSDSLCRASTGEGDVRRRLYTDGDLHVISFRRVLVVNGIDLGTLNDDLADRLITVTLTRITEHGRRLDDELAVQWQAAHPRILGALLDLTVRVLAELPTLPPGPLPRMAD
jgi:hypothetical protein